MKFEHLLQVYWLKGFLYGGNLIPFETKYKNLFKQLPGLATFSSLNFIKKFELTSFSKRNQNFSEYNEDEKRIVNMYFAQVTSVNHSFNEILRASSVRLYLIRSFRGKNQALGKPSRGQRTRSNANTAYKKDNIVKAFISQFKKTHVKVEPIKKINYKQVKRKFFKKKPKFQKKTMKKKINLWI